MTERVEEIRRTAELILDLACMATEPYEKRRERVGKVLTAALAQAERERAFHEASLAELGKWDCGHLSEGTGDEPDECRICATQRERDEVQERLQSERNRRIELHEALDAARAEVERLKGLADRESQRAEGWLRRAEQAEADLARVRAAHLELGGDHAFCPACDAEARAALEGRG